MFNDIPEAPEAEVARFAAAPVGSQSHSLSLLPVKIRGPLGDLMIELTHQNCSGTDNQLRQQ
jgi:hypothetical protein